VTGSPGRKKRKEKEVERKRRTCKAANSQQKKEKAAGRWPSCPLRPISLAKRLEGVGGPRDPEKWKGKRGGKGVNPRLALVVQGGKKEKGKMWVTKPRGFQGLKEGTKVFPYSPAVCGGGKEKRTNIQGGGLLYKFGQGKVGE